MNHNTPSLSDWKIAVVVPVYNSANYLRDCLNSILAQTHKNYKIFTVNDASYDESSIILDEYAKIDSRIIIINRMENGGISASRNSALEAIEEDGSFEYIAFCDSDDTLAPTMLEELLRAIILENADVASCGFKSYETNHLISFSDYRSFSAEEFLEQIFSLGKWSNRHGSGGFVWSRLFKADKIKGIRFCQDRNVTEDELYCTNVARNVSKITHIPRLLYTYRNTAMSLTKEIKFTQKLLSGRLMCLKIAKNISPYSAIVVACAIANTTISAVNQEIRINDNPLTENIELLLTRGKRLGLIQRSKIRKFKLITKFPKIYYTYIKLRNNLSKIK